MSYLVCLFMFGEMTLAIQWPIDCLIRGEVPSSAIGCRQTRDIEPTVFRRVCILNRSIMGQRARARRLKDTSAGVNVLSKYIHVHTSWVWTTNKLKCHVHVCVCGWVEGEEEEINSWLWKALGDERREEVGLRRWRVVGRVRRKRRPVCLFFPLFFSLWRMISELVQTGMS